MLRETYLLVLMSPKTSLFHILSFSLMYPNLRATTKLAKPFTRASPHHSLIMSLKASKPSHILSNTNKALSLYSFDVSRQIGKWSKRSLESLFRIKSRNCSSHSIDTRKRSGLEQTPSSPLLDHVKSPLQGGSIKAE